MADKFRKLQKPLGSAFLGLGVILLAAYAFVRSSNSSDSAAGLDAFEQARAEKLSKQTVEVAPVGYAAPPQTEVEAATTETVEIEPDRAGPLAPMAPVQPKPAQIALDTPPEPDFTDWSDKRIAEYKESLEAASDLPLAVLSIDHLEIKVPVYDGASELNLNRGVARIKGTARVGQQSNLGIAGHRDGFFRGLQHISVGDPINLETLTGPIRYRVTDITIVKPEDVHVLNPTESSTLTLVTCYPFYFVGSAPDRYIVTAEAEPIQVRS